jgi:hypothetical protein
LEGVALACEEDLMTTAAWAMLSVTWAVICFFTARFFIAVLRTPARSDREGEGSQG